MREREPEVSHAFPCPPLSSSFQSLAYPAVSWLPLIFPHFRGTSATLDATGGLRILVRRAHGGETPFQTILTGTSANSRSCRPALVWRRGRFPHWEFRTPDHSVLISRPLRPDPARLGPHDAVQFRIVVLRSIEELHPNGALLQILNSSIEGRLNHMAQKLHQPRRTPERCAPADSLQLCLDRTRIQTQAQPRPLRSSASVEAVISSPAPMPPPVEAGPAAVPAGPRRSLSASSARPHRPLPPSL